MRVSLFRFAFVFWRPFEELVACVTQRLRSLGFANNANCCPAFSKFSAKISEIGVARYKTKFVGAMIEHRLDGIESECNICRVFPRCVLVL